MRGSQLPAFSWVYCQPASHFSSTQLKSWELTSQPKRQYPADEKLTLTLSTPCMHLGTIVCKFGGDPIICLRVRCELWRIIAKWPIKVIQGQPNVEWRATKEEQLRDYIVQYNYCGLECEGSADIASERSEHCHLRRPHSPLTPPFQQTPANIHINLTLL